MCTKAALDELLKDIGGKLKEIFGEKLESVILYGSYARGDFDEESDIDLMALIDMERDEIRKYSDEVYDYADDLDLRYGVLLSIKLQDKSAFERYRDALPYYKNVIREGVSVSV